MTSDFNSTPARFSSLDQAVLWVVVFDKAYVDFEHLFDLDWGSVWWVTRAKENTARNDPCRNTEAADLWQRPPLWLPSGRVVSCGRCRLSIVNGAGYGLVVSSLPQFDFIRTGGKTSV
jgi:hypothetical protein